MADHFTHLHKEEIGELLAKNIYSKNSKNTTGWMTSATWRIFAELKINMHYQR